MRITEAQLRKIIREALGAPPKEAPSGAMEPHLFVRFGKFTEGGKSKIRLNADFWAPEEGAVNPQEMGLSVLGISRYNKQGGKLMILDPDRSRARYGIPHDYVVQLASDLHAKSLKAGEVFLVSGDLIPVPDFSEESWRDQKDEIADLQSELSDAEDLEFGDQVEAARLRDEIQKLRNSMGWTYAVGADGEPVISDARIIRRLDLSEVTWGRGDMTLQDLVIKIRSKGPARKMTRESQRRS